MKFCHQHCWFGKIEPTEIPYNHSLRPTVSLAAKLGIQTQPAKRLSQLETEFESVCRLRRGRGALMTAQR